MTALERIVRPFQSPGYAPPATTPQTPQPGSTPIHIEIGRNGQGYTFNGSFSSTTSRYMDATHKEDKRVTHTDRIFNPDDHTQFVDVELIDKLTTKGNNGRDYIKQEFDFNNKP